MTDLGSDTFMLIVCVRIFLFYEKGIKDRITEGLSAANRSLSIHPLRDRVCQLWKLHPSPLGLGVTIKQHKFNSHKDTHAENILNTNTHT